MNALILGLCLLETVFVVIVLCRWRKEKRVDAAAREDLLAAIWNKNDLIRTQSAQLEENEKSIANAENLMEYVKKLSQKKDTYCHSRTMNMYQTDVTYLDAKQKIYALFYEYDMLYSMDYVENKYEEFDVNKHVEHLKLECRIFYDNEIIDPALLKRIYIQGEECYIEELNIKNYEGKGIGTFYLESLEKELLNYKKINIIKGGLSPVDFKNKEQLVHFYEKNGFEVIPMKKDEWGVVEKKIR